MGKIYLLWAAVPMIPLYYTIFGYAIGFFLCKSVREKGGKGRKGAEFFGQMYRGRFLGQTIRRGQNLNREVDAMLIDKIALVLAIIGALNWGSIGLFGFDVVAFICGGQMAIISRIIYTLVGLAGLWCVSLLFRESAVSDTN